VTNVQGAQFATVRAFAGSAEAQPKKRKQEAGGGEGSRKSSRGDKKGDGLKCYRCGGPHSKNSCTEKVYCQTCKVDTHSDKCCFTAHPELREKFLKWKKDKVGKST